MIYESYSKEECLDIQKIVNPDIWSHRVRINPSDFREIYVLTWEILDPKEEAIAWKKLHEYLKSNEYKKKKLVDEAVKLYVNEDAPEWVKEAVKKEFMKQQMLSMYSVD